MKPTLSAKSIALFYWHAAWQYRGLVIGMLISVPLTVLVSNFLPPLIIAGIVNKLSSHGYQAHHVWQGFGKPLIGYTALSLLGGVAGWRLVDNFNFKLEGKVKQALSTQVFKKMLDLSPDFHADHFGGSLVSQTNKLLNSYVRIVDTTVYMVLSLLFSIVFTIIILIPRAPLFVLALTIFAIIYIISAILITQKVRELAAKEAASESRQTGMLADAITNIMAIKSYANSLHEQKRFRVATDESHGYLLDMMHTQRRTQSYFGGVSSIISSIALALAVVDIVNFGGQLGTVFLILNYTTSIVGQLFSFSNNSLRNYNRAFGDAADMIEILSLKPTIRDPEQPETNRIKKGAIRFKEVTFSHEADNQLFEHLNLSIKAGEKVGLVGHSGSGKTTFSRLILRFNDLQAGEILIDGQNIAAVSQEDLRRSISYVPQEPLLFHRSLAENIAYGKLDATEQAITDAAQQAHASDFINKLPDGYGTLVGERGIKLSGGQRQRIAIARAMLKNAPILLLDEATSALDSESEVLIQDALWKLMEGRTAIVIAHRLSTIQRMDRIIVLDDGNIAEQGSHSELLKLNGTYAKLWAHQSGGFIED